MGTISYLAASAACAALLGMAASGFVGSHVCSLLASKDVVTATDGEGHDGQGSTPAAQIAVFSNHAPEPELSQLDGRNRAAAVCARGSSRSTGRARRTQPASTATDSLAEELGRGIRKLGEHRYEIKRSVVDLATANLMSVSQWARATLELRDGKPFGFRLFAVDPEGPFAKLGLRDGDILISVNGLALATPDQALEAFGKLRTARHLVLKLMRDGRQVTQEYVVR